MSALRVAGKLDNEKWREIKRNSQLNCPLRADGTPKFGLGGVYRAMKSGAYRLRRRFIANDSIGRQRRSIRLKRCSILYSSVVCSSFA
eukprot:scaffold10434_cov72-Skeletonema_dohrnii-CCMP3373.AAC.1